MLYSLIPSFCQLKGGYNVCAWSGCLTTCIDLVDSIAVRIALSWIYLKIVIAKMLHVNPPHHAWMLEVLILYVFCDCFSTYVSNVYSPSVLLASSVFNNYPCTTKVSTKGWLCASFGILAIILATFHMVSYSSCPCLWSAGSFHVLNL